MGRRGRTDLKLLEALDRAVAFDRTVERARFHSPSLFPPEITCKKSLLPDGTHEHVFHHNTLGELGRLRIEERGGSIHIEGVVSGHTDEPQHGERDALFRPLMEEFARAGNLNCVQGKHLPCARCGAIAASLMFIEGTTVHDFEKCERLMHPEYSSGSAAVWIIGPPVGHGPEAERAADILKVWPKREQLRRLRPQEFNLICSRSIGEHCSGKTRTENRGNLNKRH